MKTILDLEIGESAYIADFDDQSLACKLLTIGLLPKSEITVVRYAPFGQSLYIKMNHQIIAIRKKEAQSILLEI